MAASQVINDLVRVSARRPSLLRDFITLTKPEVNLLILMTTSTGFYLASEGQFKIWGLVHTLIGTLLVASGTATLNQCMERTWDGQMRRTANRPLPTGRLSLGLAVTFGILVSLAGGIYLDLLVNRLAAVLAVSTLLAYLLVYTPLKRVTPLCTLLGAFPGAMPTLIGWAGASNGINRQAWFLFGILFLWQFPHFLAIALMYKDDYAKAGYHMLPQFDRETRFTRAEIIGFTLVLIAITMLPAISGGRAIYSLGMFAAGGFLLYHALQLAQASSKSLAGRLLHASVIYLPVVLGIMIAAKH